MIVKNMIFVLRGLIFHPLKVRFFHGREKYGKGYLARRPFPHPPPFRFFAIRKENPKIEIWVHPYSQFSF